MQPIWKDYYVNLGTAESIEYKIMAENDFIYSGIAHKRPGQTNNTIRINEICSDYLNNVLPSMTDGAFAETEIPTFKVVAKTGEATMSLIDSVQFINDWSYDYDFDPSNGLSAPINGHIDPRQWMVVSVAEKTSINIDIFYEGDMLLLETIPLGIPGDFNIDFNADFVVALAGSHTGTAVFNVSKYPGAKLIRIGSNAYEVSRGCDKYALYYVNAHGGWDSFLVEGNHSERDELTRYTRNVEGSNESIQSRGEQNYINEIRKSLTLHSSWLSDEQSSRMHHLLNSTEVFLYDIAKDQMIPVVLKNTTTEYKTYKNNGGRLVNYAIEVTFANERIRR